MLRETMPKGSGTGHCPAGRQRRDIHDLGITFCYFYALGQSLRIFLRFSILLCYNNPVVFLLYDERIRK